MTALRSASSHAAVATTIPKPTSPSASVTAFGVARWRQDGAFAVRRALAPVTERRAERLPAPVRRFHEQHTHLRLAAQ